MAGRIIVSDPPWCQRTSGSLPELASHIDHWHWRSKFARTLRCAAVFLKNDATDWDRLSDSSMFIYRLVPWCRGPNLRHSAILLEKLHKKTSQRHFLLQDVYDVWRLSSLSAPLHPRGIFPGALKRAPPVFEQQRQGMCLGCEEETLVLVDLVDWSNTPSASPFFQPVLLCSTPWKKHLYCHLFEDGQRKCFHSFHTQTIRQILVKWLDRLASWRPAFAGLFEHWHSEYSLMFVYIYLNIIYLYTYAENLSIYLSIFLSSGLSLYLSMFSHLIYPSIAKSWKPPNEFLMQPRRDKENSHHLPSQNQPLSHGKRYHQPKTPTETVPSGSPPKILHHIGEVFKFPRLELFETSMFVLFVFKFTEGTECKNHSTGLAGYIGWVVSMDCSHPKRWVGGQKAANKTAKKGHSCWGAQLLDGDLFVPTR